MIFAAGISSKHRRKMQRQTQLRLAFNPFDYDHIARPSSKSFKNSFQGFIVQRKSFSFLQISLLFFLRFSMGYSREIVVFRVHPSKPRERESPVARGVQRNRTLDGRHLSALSAQMTLLNHRSATPWTPGWIGLPVLAPCSASTMRRKPAADY